ncbi:hypothetical protein [Allorhodopirellula heiligendammensis]|uniref:Uncharacterized protein n=1 Tax=Allorhodopirellula heiligendammensis TaxID=2714739 RepID=A0A5C6C7Y4_9BACT|nr:hypothetical protein [Allorhodopirellula heiligendammensis]TWU19536.1 hypothetical protein Poly21_17100 [Allorhodopirellula heiligendammensis]
MNAESMTLDEAVELAKRVQQTNGLKLQAIGRFLPDAELTTTPERWGVSIVLADGKRKVLWNSLSLAMITPPAKANAPKAKPARRRSADDRQEVLF